MPNPLINTSTWKRYKALIKKGAESFNKEQIILAKWQHGIDQWQEDTSDSANYQYIKLDTLIQYNYFQVWPINVEQEDGQIDRQHMSARFNRKYLSDIGMLDNHGNFPLEPSKDVFIHRGTEYRIVGDTFTSQAKNDPLQVMVILRRQEVPTGASRAFREEEVVDRTLDQDEPITPVTPTIIFFGASTYNVPAPPGDIELVWFTQGSTQVSISGIGYVNPFGTVTVNISGETTFTLTLTHGDTLITEEVIITVIPPVNPFTALTDNTQSPIYYIGWTDDGTTYYISRITVALDGTSVSASATGAWDDRYTLIYT
jgi:hypothetical protein